MRTDDLAFPSVAMLIALALAVFVLGRPSILLIGVLGLACALQALGAILSRRARQRARDKQREPMAQSETELTVYDRLGIQLRKSFDRHFQRLCDSVVQAKEIVSSAASTLGAASPGRNAMARTNTRRCANWSRNCCYSPPTPPTAKAAQVCSALPSRRAVPFRASLPSGNCRPILSGEAA